MLKKSDPIFLNSEEGQGLVEYSLIIALIALVVIAGLMNFQTALGLSINTTSNAINGAIAGS